MTTNSDIVQKEGSSEGMDLFGLQSGAVLTSPRYLFSSRPPC